MGSQQGTRPCLLLVDFQTGVSPESGYYGSDISSKSYETNVPRLLDAFRRKDLPVAHVQHDSVHADSPLHPSKPGNAVLPFAAPLPTEPLFRKSVNSGLIGTGLERLLKEWSINRLVIAGLTTDHCVSTTVRMAANLDVVGSNPPGTGEIFLVGDACAAFGKQGWEADAVHQINLASLNGEFCKVVQTGEVLKLIEG